MSQWSAKVLPAAAAAAAAAQSDVDQRLSQRLQTIVSNDRQIRAETAHWRSQDL